MYILGQTAEAHTEALLTTQTGLLGYGQGGPANYTVNGTSGVVQSVLTAVRGSLEQSGLQLENLHQRGVVLALGVSGAGRSAEQVQIRRALESEGFAQVVVAHDAVIALLGALSGADGVVVIAGTGSVAYGVNGGRSHRVGGWGYLLGDEGGAVWIALKALQQVMWGYDGRLTEDETLLQSRQGILRHQRAHGADPHLQNTTGSRSDPRGLVQLSGNWQRRPRSSAGDSG